ncbi:hypothetical protein ACHAXT_011013 [Thalassiosira profunda]
MVRGNWQRRVERTEAARAERKLQKELRRTKRTESAGEGLDPKASYRQLEEWLDDKGDGIGVSREDGLGGREAVTHDAGADGACASSRIAVDVWVDARPKNRPEYLPIADDPYEDDFDDEGGRKKGKSKGKHKEQKDRGGFKKKGKAHPNAKNKSTDEGAGRERSGSINRNAKVKDQRLCGQEFFFGKEKCKGTLQLKQQKGGRKRSGSIGGEGDIGCTLQHYHQLPKVKGKGKGVPHTQPMTLCAVLNEKLAPHHVQHGEGSRPVASLPNKVREAALKSAYDAAVDANAGSLDMLYHTRLFVENKVAVDSGDEDSGSDDSVSSYEQNDGSEGDGEDSRGGGQRTSSRDKKSAVLEGLERMLENEKLDSTSLVYLAIQGVVIYDRYRGGPVSTDSEERFLLFGNEIEDAIPEAVDAGGDQPMKIHEQLGHHLLDEILSYCDDESTGILPQVCATWRDEVGTRSPQLWRMLLSRHGWPSIVTGEENESPSEADAMQDRDQRRRAFISHYTAARDVRAVANACNHMNCDGSLTQKLEMEAALQIYKATNGAPVLEGLQEGQTIDNMSLVEIPYCFVKVWSSTYDGKSTRALGAFGDCTLRLFEVVRGTSSDGIIKCRQVVCVRASPPSSSRKKDSCRLWSCALDDNVVACFFEEAREEVLYRGNNHDADDQIPWLVAISREDIICAGNEGMLEDECIQSFDLRGVVLDFLLGNASGAGYELSEGLHDFLSNDGLMDDVYVEVTSTLVSCGMGHFLFHAYIAVPSGVESTTGNRLFIFSTKNGRIVQSLHLEGHRDSTKLFSSRPHRRRASATTPAAYCTNVMVSDPTVPLLQLSVEVMRDGTVNFLTRSMIDHDAFAPWSRMKAAMTSSYAVFSTNPFWHGPLLHFQRLCTSLDESLDGRFHTIEMPGRNSKLHSMFVIREHYVAVVVTNRQAANGEEGDDDDAIDGHWFGEDEEQTSTDIVVYHLPTRTEVYRSPIPSETLSLDCVGDTLAANLSHFGFAITGGNARDVGRAAISEGQLASPSGKNPKGKKKRLASLASGRKKDGFARGMSLRG